MNFLVDAQLPPALARLIASLGHQAVHVEETTLLLASDEEIWAYALRHQHIIITKDEDFKNLLLLSTAGRTPVVWMRIGNCSNAALTRWFQPLFPQVLGYLQQGEYLIELY
jgi:predicted nuclease of predicted toxin-antitoxin system